MYNYHYRLIKRRALDRVHTRVDRHFCIFDCDLDLWPFDLILIDGWWTIPVPTFVIVPFSRFGFIVRTNRQTHTHTHTDGSRTFVWGAGRAPKARVSRRRRRRGGWGFGRGVPSLMGRGLGRGPLPHQTVHNARINKVKACKKLRYLHQTVQRHHQVMF